MAAMIACVAAVICAAAFLSLWFTVSYRILMHKFREVEAAAEQIRMHYDLYRQKRGSPNAEAAKRMLDTSRMIYRESQNSYNQVYRKLLYHLPGFLMGFRFMKEKEPKEKTSKGTVSA